MQRKWLPGAAFVLAVAVIMDLGCGGKSSPIVVPPPSGVTIAHSAKVLDASQSVSLTATVSNDPNNMGVKWTVACPSLFPSPVSTAQPTPMATASGLSACGEMAKAVSASGAADKYTAPNSVSAAGTLTITATSVSDPTKFASVDLTVDPTPTLVNPPPTQPPGNVGQPVWLDLTQYVQGGSSPFTCSIKSGALPAGLTMDASKVIVSGIPTAVSALTVIVFHCADSGAPPLSVDVSVSITINAMLPFAISPAPGALPAGTVGTLYNLVCHWRWGCTSGFHITASGGVVPYGAFSWSAVAGSSLPPGLSIDSGGFISGTPTTAGTYNFVVTVTDSESPPKQASANYTITVAPAPSPSPSPSASP